MSPEEIKGWVTVALNVANALISAGLWLYVRYGDRNKEVDAKFSALRTDFDTRADTHDMRLASLEAHVRHMPTHDDLAKLYERVNVVAQTTAQMSGQLNAMNTNLHTLTAQLLERGLNR